MVRRRDRSDGGAVETPATRFLRSAALCRTRDLKQLLLLSELVKSMAELIHALQKERGASSIFLGSNGTQFADRLAAHTVDSRQFEAAVREGLEHVGDKPDRMSSGTRFYTRVALAFRALDTLSVTRAQIASLTVAPQDAVTLHKAKSTPAKSARPQGPASRAAISMRPSSAVYNTWSLRRSNPSAFSANSRILLISPSSRPFSVVRSPRT
ncbi:MAG: hypothetical protein E6K49_12025 [Gammaproteobacteria bacterium]|nr:MAG: hypothetical protein E6K49_12025 [Gammaproteobacteria bacterium]